MTELLKTRLLICRSCPDRTGDRTWPKIGCSLQPGIRRCHLKRPGFSCPAKPARWSAVADPITAKNLTICMACPARTLTCPVWRLLSARNRAKALRGDRRFQCPANKLELQPPLVLRSSGVGPERSKNNGKDAR